MMLIVVISKRIHNEVLVSERNDKQAAMSSGYY